MSQRNRISAALFVGTTAAVLTLALPVEARSRPRRRDRAGGEARGHRQPDDGAAAHHQGDHHQGHEDHPAPDQAAKLPTEVGDTVPSGIPLQPMPVEVSAKVPQLKAHSFLVKDDKVDHRRSEGQQGRGADRMTLRPKEVVQRKTAKSLTAR